MHGNECTLLVTIIQCIVLINDNTNDNNLPFADVHLIHHHHPSTM